MVSSEEVYTPVRSYGCLWAVTKVLVVFAIALIFGIGLLVGFFLTAVSNFLV